MACKPLRLWLSGVLSLAAASFGWCGEFASPLQPSSQPLATARAASAKGIERMLSTRQMRLLADRDYSGPLPGLGVSVDSLRGFSAALAREGAESVWYCVTQKGSSPFGTAAMGWSVPAGVDVSDRRAVDEWLAALGLDAGNAVLELYGREEDEQHLTLSRDEDARKEFLGGGPSMIAWRKSFESFLRDGGDGLGILLNTRPLLGVASLMSGVDFRSLLSDFSLDVPTEARVELFDNGGDLGIEVRLCRMLRSRRGGTEIRTGARTAIAVDPDAFLEVRLLAPEFFQLLLDRCGQTLFLANINIRSLIPSTAAIAFRRDEALGVTWSAAFLMPRREEFLKQFGRIRSWLDILSSGSSPVVTVADAVAPDGGDCLFVDAGSVSFALDVMDAPGGGAFLVLAGSARGLPTGSSLELFDEEKPGLGHFEARLSPADRRAVAEALAKMAGAAGLGYEESAIMSALPDEDYGEILMEGEDLRISSERTLLPLLIPVITGGKTSE